MEPEDAGFKAYVGMYVPDVAPTTRTFLYWNGIFELEASDTKIFV